MTADPTCATCHGTGVIESENWHEVEYHDCPTCAEREPRTVTLTILGTPAYTLSPNSRSHWGVKQRETKDARIAVRCAIEYPGLIEGRPVPTLSGRLPVKLHWTVYLAKGGKRRDADNMLASLKAHQDALDYWGVIPGDSPKWIPETPTVEQIVWSKHRSEPRIVVVIEEVQQ